MPIDEFKHCVRPHLMTWISAAEVMIWTELGGNGITGQVQISHMETLRDHVGNERSKNFKAPRACGAPHGGYAKIINSCPLAKSSPVAVRMSSFASARTDHLDRAFRRRKRARAWLARRTLELFSYRQLSSTLTPTRSRRAAPPTPFALPKPITCNCKSRACTAESCQVAQSQRLTEET